MGGYNLNFYCLEIASYLIIIINSWFQKICPVCNESEDLYRLCLLQGTHLLLARFFVEDLGNVTNAMFAIREGFDQFFDTLDEVGNAQIVANCVCFQISCAGGTILKNKHLIKLGFE